MERILVVDDDTQVVVSIRYMFPQRWYDFRSVTSATEAMQEFQRDQFAIVICATQLPDSTGLLLLDGIRKLDGRVPVILMVDDGHSDAAIEAISRGAYHYIKKPMNPADVQSVVESALKAARLMRSEVVLPINFETDADDATLLIGNCPAMHAVFRQIGVVAGLDVAVLILGETGTGKEVVARTIYQLSQRALQPFLVINCAIPEGRLARELFGQEAGLVSGAKTTRIGKFERLDGGTVFLDEITEMSTGTQAKVLRIIHDEQFERIDGTEAIHANIRFIAASEHDIAKKVQDATFDAGLFDRLRVYTIQLPPLRERTSDLPLLIKHFVYRHSRELNKKIVSVSPQTVRLLSEYNWPGNIRELQSVLKHATIEATGPVILPEFVPEAIRKSTTRFEIDVENADADAATDQLAQFIRERIAAGTDSLYSDVIQLLERRILTVLVQELQGNTNQAAAILGFTSSALRKKLATLGIKIDKSPPEPPREDS